MTRATNLTNFKYKIVPVALIRNFIIAIAINASISQQKPECFFLKNSTKGFESFITTECIKFTTTLPMISRTFSWKTRDIGEFQ